MSFRVVITVAFLIMASWFSTSAQIENNQFIEQIIEPIAENADEDLDQTEIVEKYINYQKKPLNLNKAEKEQLEGLLILSPFQILALLEYRQHSGALVDLLELQNIEGFDIGTIKKILPFVTLSDSDLFTNISFKNIIQHGEHTLMFRTGRLLENQKGYLIPDSSSKSNYTGTPEKMYMQYKLKLENKLSVGLTMEKDPGESFFSGHQKTGFDFYSGHIFLKSPTGKIRKVVVGDYALQFGQGLTLWSGLSSGKGAAIATVVRQDAGIKPYTSANESSFFRGTAATFALKNVSLTPFVSYKNIDGNLNDQDNAISAIAYSGLHRTQTEAENKNKIDQFVYGSVFQLENRKFKVGAIAYHTRFNKAFSGGNFEYNRHSFSSSDLTNLGLYYNYTWRNVFLFGEAAKSLNSGYAYQVGALVSLSPAVSLSLLKRDYQKNYHSFFNSAFAESSNAVNEKGFYSGISFKPFSKIEITSYVDFFKFPWLKFRVDAPSSGFEILTQIIYSPAKKISAIFRYKRENKEENDDELSEINYLETVRRASYRIELNYKINTDFQFRNRLEVSQYQKGNDATQSGFLIYQDLIYNPVQSKISGNFRFALFDTPGFDTRIYAYENGLLYDFSSPAFQNKGIRFYINSRIKMKRGIDFGLRYAITKYVNIDQIGSGLDLIEGNKKSEIKAQLRLQF